MQNEYQGLYPNSGARILSGYFSRGYFASRRYTVTLRMGLIEHMIVSGFVALCKYQLHSSKVFNAIVVFLQFLSSAISLEMRFHSPQIEKSQGPSDHDHK